MTTMAKTKITSRAKLPDKTETFVMVIQTALEMFDDEITSLTQEVCMKAYKNFIKSYRTALTAVWDLAHFTDVALILATIHNKEMVELSVMAWKLKTPAPTTYVVKEQRKVPTLETITGAMMSQYPQQALPDAAVCKKIDNMFSKLSTANKAYSEAAEGLAELSTQVSPQHFTLLLMAATAPVIQIIVPPKMISPVVAPPPPSPPTATPMGCTAIIDFTKTKVLPNPDAPALQECNKNTATEVLAAAIYSKLEHKFFDDMHSRIDVAMALRCNVSQLTKALTGIEYTSGPHHYKPKGKSAKKRATEEGKPSKETPPKQQKLAPKVKLQMGEHPTTPAPENLEGPDKAISEDTLESESRSSDLPLGL